MKIYSYRVIIEPDEDGYHGYVPTLPGCHTWGKSVEETKKNLREAIRCHVESLILDGEKIPQDKGLESIEIFQEEEFKPKHPSKSQPIL